MLLYDKGDPIRAVEILGPGHPQRPRQGRQPPEGPGHLGRGSAARPGAGEHPRSSCRRCKKVGYRGPLCIEREVGDQQQRFDDIAHGVRFIREVLS